MNETVSLSNDFLTITTRSQGGELISIKDQKGTEFLWQGDATYWPGQAPVLFPIVGKIPEGMTTEDGRAVSMPRHGFARRQTFAIREEISNKVAYCLTENEETLEEFPFPFQLDVAYSLKDHQVLNTFTVTNTGSTPLPFQIGGHPAFRCPLEPEDNYEDASLIFEKNEQIESPLLDPDTGLINYKNRYRVLYNESTLKLRHSLFRKDALIIENPNSQQVTLSIKEKPVLQFQYLGFPYLVLWSSANDGPFICLEPWTGLPSALKEDSIFEHKRGIITLAPKESRSFTYIITICS